MVSVLFIKLIVSIALVLTLSAVAEHVSPRAAGLLAGYPAGAAITLFFIGLDLGADYWRDAGRNKEADTTTQQIGWVHEQGSGITQNDSGRDTSSLAHTGSYRQNQSHRNNRKQPQRTDVDPPL